MTRPTTAERTLLTQIEHFESRQRDVMHQVELLNAQIATYNVAILDLNTELSRVRSRRIQASDRNKP